MVSTGCVSRCGGLGVGGRRVERVREEGGKRRSRLWQRNVTGADVLAPQPVTTNLLKFMRASIKMIGVSNLQSFIASITKKLTLSDISNEAKKYLDKAGITSPCLRIKSTLNNGRNRKNLTNRIPT